MPALATDSAMPVPMNPAPTMPTRSGSESPSAVGSGLTYLTLANTKSAPFNVLLGMVGGSAASAGSTLRGARSEQLSDSILAQASQIQAIDVDRGAARQRTVDSFRQLLYDPAQVVRPSVRSCF
jgi:hypothetical protein